MSNQEGTTDEVSSEASTFSSTDTNEAKEVPESSDTSTKQGTSSSALAKSSATKIPRSPRSSSAPTPPNPTHAATSGAHTTSSSSDTPPTSSQSEASTTDSPSGSTINGTPRTPEIEGNLSNLLSLSLRKHIEERRRLEAEIKELQALYNEAKESRARAEKMAKDRVVKIQNDSNTNKKLTEFFGTPLFRHDLENSRSSLQRTASLVNVVAERRKDMAQRKEQLEAEERLKEGEKISRKFFGEEKFERNNLNALHDASFAAFFRNYQTQTHIDDSSEDEGEDSSTSKSKEQGSVQQDHTASSSAPTASPSSPSLEEPQKQSTATATGGATSTPQKTTGGTTVGPSGKDEDEETESTDSLLGSFVGLRKSYLRELEEFDEVLKRTQGSPDDHVQFLHETLTKLMKEHRELQAKARASEENTQFLESFSAGVKLFEKQEDGSPDQDATDWKKPTSSKGSRRKKRPSSGSDQQPQQSAEKENEKESAMITTQTTTTTTKEAEKNNKRGSKKRAGKRKKRSSERNILSHPQKVPSDVVVKKYHEISYDELELDSTPLGNGAFGVVYKGLWRGTTVAVKKLMVMLNEEEVYNFKREASLMEKFSNHPNIVKFCGISTEFPHYCIITEYSERGCARDALMKHPDVPWKTIVRMALDAAAGVLHLHCESIVHRDLALRNLLVSKDWKVRVADFGLARMIPKETYAKTRGNIGAVRWLAPEVILKHIYSEKSDVYSFGIVMWELVTRGEEPFDNIDNVLEVAIGIMNNALRPEIPKDCPPEWEKLMCACWDQDPEKRPDFAEIHKQLKTYLDSLPD
ncbi:Serine/threonine-protein kinase STY17 [Balamuthia mandrillaris]